MSDEAYIAAARRDPAIRRQTRTTLDALAFHLWAMTREERADITVESLRETRRGLPHGYITDDEIAAVLRQENERVWIDPMARAA